VLVSAESLLRDFLEAQDPARRNELLEALVFEQAEPVVRRIVWRRLGTSAPVQDREDTVSDAVVELVGRLTTLHRGESNPIANFVGYAAVTAHHGCDHYLRFRFPQRHRLKARLRYLLESASGTYALWEAGSGAVVCGRLKWRGQPPAGPLDPGWFRAVPLAAAPDEKKIVAAIFEHMNAPLELDDLVEGAAALSGVIDESPASFEDAEQRVAAPANDAVERIDQRRRVEQLWLEIQELPHPQRVALLLNLRDDTGISALVSLPALGVASMRKIAVVLEMPAEELAALWGRLPLSDLEIAARLSLERQQIINLRKSARQRLARRTESGNIVSISSSRKEKVGRG
jgi:RNA polymerase sigma factor (sigma-70 family)